jgi:hypothetical protein
MSCERFRKAINGHAAGADITGAAADHLVSCASCRARVERHRQVLAEVDAELATMLSIGATPEFVARVTSSAAAAGRRSIAWRPAAAWMGLAAAAALVMALFLRAPAPAPQPDAASRSAAADPAPTAAPPAARTAEPSAVPRPTVARRSQPHSSPRVAAAVQPPEEPPVVVDGSQARAIARLRELLSAGRLNEKMLPPERSHDTAELAVAPLEIPEIKVPDIEFAGRPPGSAVNEEPKER